MRWNSSRTEIGSAVDPVRKYGFSDDRSSPRGGFLASVASVVGTADRRETRYASTNFQ